MIMMIVIWSRHETAKKFPNTHQCKRLYVNYFIFRNEQLESQKPHYDPTPRCDHHTKATGKLIIDAEMISIKEKPDGILVGGEINLRR
jgi:hypothetical protein